MQHLGSTRRKSFGYYVTHIRLLSDVEVLDGIYRYMNIWLPPDVKVLAITWHTFEFLPTWKLWLINDTRISAPNIRAWAVWLTLSRECPSTFHFNVTVNIWAWAVGLTVELESAFRFGGFGCLMILEELHPTSWKVWLSRDTRHSIIVPSALEAWNLKWAASMSEPFASSVSEVLYPKCTLLNLKFNR